MENFLIQSNVIVHPKSIVLYGERLYTESQSPNRDYSHLAKVSKRCSNQLSNQSIRKIKHSVDYLLVTSTSKKAWNNKINKQFKFNLSFITLTLSASQSHCDKKIKQALLHQFLIEAKKKWHLSRYVWRQEYQHKTGNWHCHILTNIFVPHQELRNVWNRIQNKLGYIDKFNERHNHINPNSTDIHSVKKIKDLSRYITKYMVKNKSNHIRMTRGASDIKRNREHFPRSVSHNVLKFLRDSQICGRVWGCSYDLSKIQGAKSEIIDKYYNEIEILKKDNRYKEYVGDYYTVIYFRQNELDCLKYPNLYKLFASYLYTHFGHSIQSEIFNMNSSTFYSNNLLKL